MGKKEKGNLTVRGSWRRKRKREGSSIILEVDGCGRIGDISKDFIALLLIVAALTIDPLKTPLTQFDEGY